MSRTRVGSRSSRSWAGRCRQCRTQFCSPTSESIQYCCTYCRIYCRQLYVGTCICWSPVGTCAQICSCVDFTCIASSAMPKPPPSSTRRAKFGRMSLSDKTDKKLCRCRVYLHGQLGNAKAIALQHQPCQLRQSGERRHTCARSYHTSRMLPDHTVLKQPAAPAIAFLHCMVSGRAVCSRCCSWL